MSFFNTSDHLPPLPDLTSSSILPPSRQHNVRAKQRPSCLNCRKNHKKCGDVRPCNTCIATGKAETCSEFPSSMSYATLPAPGNSMRLDDDFRQPMPSSTHFDPLFQSSSASSSLGSFTSSRNSSFDSGYSSFLDSLIDPNLLSIRPSLSTTKPKDLPPLPPLSSYTAQKCVTFILGTDLRIGRASDECLRLLGYHSHEMVMQNFSFYLQAADRPKLDMLAAQLLLRPFVSGTACPATPVELQRRSLSELSVPIAGVQSIFGTLRLRKHNKAYTTCSIELHLGSCFGGSFSSPNKAFVILKATPLTNAGISFAIAGTTSSAGFNSFAMPSNVPGSNVRQGRRPSISRETFTPINDFTIPSMPDLPDLTLNSKTSMEKGNRRRGSGTMDYAYDHGSRPVSGSASLSPQDSLWSSDGGHTFTTTGSFANISPFSLPCADLPPLPPLTRRDTRPSISTAFGTPAASTRHVRGPSGQLPTLNNPPMDFSAAPPIRQARRPSIPSNPFDRHTWPQSKRRERLPTSGSILDGDLFRNDSQTLLPPISSWAPEPLRYYSKPDLQVRHTSFGQIGLGGPRRGSLF